MSTAAFGRPGQGRRARTVRVIGAGLVLVAAPVGLPTTAATPSSAAASAWCRGEAATVVGTDRSETILGTPGRDVVVARGGDDTIRTGGGTDVVCAGDDFDHVRLGGGRDWADGGAGDDMLIGGRGADLLLGEGGVDGLAGGPGDDQLLGGPGQSINVEALRGGPGDDRLVGGPGLDSAHFFDAPAGVRVDLEKGSARGHGRDVLVGVEGVVGSNHDDVILGDRGSNGLFGQAGDDRIDARGSGPLATGRADVMSGDQGRDTLIGGLGQDLVTYARLPLAVVVDLRQHRARGQGPDRLAGVEAVEGSLLDDRLAGGRDAELFAGSLGDDVIDGRGGADTVIYSDVRGPVEVVLDPSLLAPARRATADGYGTGDAAGRDVLLNLENIWGTGQADTLHGDDGPNHLRGMAGDDLLVGHGGADRLDGGDGQDTCQDAPEQTTDCEAT